jgi:hypothetical protein
MYEFRPPKVQRRFSHDHRDFLWTRVSYEEGLTVVKTTSGGYRQEAVHNPDADDVDVIYSGGHVYLVDDDEAAALTTAGYGSCLQEATP